MNRAPLPSVMESIQCRILENLISYLVLLGNLCVCKEEIMKITEQQ